MNGAGWAAWITSGISLVAAITALLKARSDQRRGISSDEREARRDTIADRDSLLERLERRLEKTEAHLEKVEERLTLSEDGHIAKALIIRAQDGHIDLLEDWIWEGKAPPPPPRPDITREAS